MDSKTDKEWVGSPVCHACESLSPSQAGASAAKLCDEFFVYLLLGEPLHSASIQGPRYLQCKGYGMVGRRAKNDDGLRGYTTRHVRLLQCDGRRPPTDPACRCDRRQQGRIIHDPRLDQGHCGERTNQGMFGVRLLVPGRAVRRPALPVPNWTDLRHRLGKAAQAANGL